MSDDLDFFVRALLTKLKNDQGIYVNLMAPHEIIMFVARCIEDALSDVRSGAA